MKLKLLAFLMLLISYSMFSRDFTLDECINLSVEKSTYSKQQKYFESISELRKMNYSSAFLPQFRLEASANYQSDVFAFPLKLPNVSIPEVEKFQYQASLNIYQNIYEGGMAKSAEISENAELEVNQAGISVNNQKIKEIVSDLYFNVLIINQNLKINDNYLKTIETKKKQIQQLVINGVLLKSAELQLDIELLKLNQKMESLNKDKQTLLKMLAQWIENDSIIDANIVIPSESNLSDKLNRPELVFFAKKNDLLIKKKDVVNSQIMPSLSGFVKAGFGSPNPFNMFESDLSPFYMVGIKFQWNVWDWSNNSRSKEELDVNRKLIQIEEENFNKNLSKSLIKEMNDVDKYAELIKKDLEIINLQKIITEQYNSQVLNGTATMTEYITEMNNLNQQQINYETHKVQLINAKVNYSIKLGN